MEGVRLTTDELIRLYGVTRRLAVRLGALAARRLTVTPTLLEIAGAGSRVEKLLLHPQMLDQADRLDTAAAEKLAQESGADEEGALVVVADADGRVLALEEELAAADAGQGEEQPAPLSMVRPGARLPAAQMLHRAETEHLFTPDEIARLKLDAVAGRDVDTRVSALRKLLYAPLPAREKGAVYLRALVDPARAVRGEAVRALESLGFNRDTADALQRVFGPDARQCNQALRRIGDLLGQLQEAEREIVLVVLAERLREERPTAADDPLVRVLIESLPLLRHNAELVRELTRIAVQHLAADFTATQAALSGLLLALAEAAPEAVLEKCREEVDTIRASEPRAFLVGLLIEIESDDGQKKHLCETVLDELLGGDHDELARQKLGHSMTALGAPLIRAILRRYETVTNPERAGLVPFMDALGLDESLPPAARAQLPRALLESLKMADRPLRLAILRTRLFNRADLAPGLRKPLAAELLPLLRQSETPELAEHAALMLESLGETAVKGLFDTVRSAPAAPEADRAVRALARILTRPGLAPATARTARLVLDFTAQHAAQPRNRLGGYAFALGELAAAGLGGAEAAQKAFALLADRMAHCAWPEDAARALGRLGASKLVSPPQRLAAVHLLSGLVDRPPSAEEARMREVATPRGPVYELDGQVDFDSATLPAAVAGLEDIALCEAATDALRDSIVGMFMRVWQGVAAWKIIWGPRSAARLALALGRIGADRRTDDATRVKILDALAGGLERLSVIRSVAVLFAVPAAAETFNDRILAVAGRMLEQWLEPEIAPEELQAVLCAAATVAARPDISGRTKRAREFRQRVAQLLFDALRNGRAWSRAPLERIRDCPTVPRNLRRDIAKRLEQAFVVVPS